MTSLDGINGQSIQTLLRGENDSKQSDQIQAAKSAFSSKINKLQMSYLCQIFNNMIKLWSTLRKSLPAASYNYCKNDPIINLHDTTIEF